MIILSTVRRSTIASCLSLLLQQACSKKIITQRKVCESNFLKKVKVRCCLTRLWLPQMWIAEYWDHSRRQLNSTLKQNGLRLWSGFNHLTNIPERSSDSLPIAIPICHFASFIFSYPTKSRRCIRSCNRDNQKFCHWGLAFCDKRVGCCRWRVRWNFLGR